MLRASLTAVAPHARGSRDRNGGSRPSLYQSLLGDLPPQSMGARYSVNKARRFRDYARTTSALRQLGMVIATPFPALLLSLVVTRIPLQDPAQGALANWGVWLQASLIMVTAMASAMVGFRAAASIDHSEYSTRAIAAIAGIAATLQMGFVFGVALLWRFPLPFSWIVGLLPYSLTFSLAHYAVLRGRIVRNRALRAKLLACLPAFSLQISQVAIYAAYSVAFRKANDWQRLGLVVVFPLLKYWLKRGIFMLARGFKDHACESAVSGVEICASMYQASVVQSTPSPLVSACIIGIDVLICVVDIVRMIYRREGILPAAEILPKSLELLGDVDTSAPRASIPNTRRSTNRVRPAPTASILSSTARRQANKLAIAQALELLQCAETVVLVEYLEVVVPVVNTVHVVIAAQQPSAIYDPKIREFYGHPSALEAAVANVVLYAALQGVTLVGLGVAVQWRYKISALALLAFVLEFHAWALQAKLVCWMPLMFAFPVVHYGVDFTFSFEFPANS